MNLNPARLRNFPPLELLLSILLILNTATCKIQNKVLIDTLLLLSIAARSCIGLFKRLYSHSGLAERRRTTETITHHVQPIAGLRLRLGQ